MGSSQNRHLLQPRSAEGKFVRHLVVGAEDGCCALEEEEHHDERKEAKAPLVLRLPALHHRSTRHLA